ncbi:OmpP1/FadL family transporter [Flavobacterium sp. RSB2_4_14]|uniref:OmpP1/FadL family transporter n=1 Tax=Flavobacterium sp. RSB2_4_14 TaxID=3447665 RepID=UPI003F2FA0CD
MKKFIIINIIMLAISYGSYAQEVSDALRYSQDNLNGTARFRALSGAFGALGGDLSSINVNPAGSAVFSNNQFGTTISNFSTKNNSSYFGTNTSECDNSFDLNQAGMVFVFNNNNTKNDWRKFSIALNYENANNFDNSTFSAGTNPTNSVDGYFLHYANQNGGVSVTNLQLQDGETITSLYSYLGSVYGFGAQQAFLGYQAYIIDPAANYDEISNRSYVSLVPGGGNYYQENYYTTDGYNGKLNFNFATQYKDFLYLGINLNSHFTSYSQYTNFYERNNQESDEIRINRLQFENRISTYGNGFSFQLGAIAKVTKEFRLGLSYDSPTWYNLNDELSQSVVGVSSNNLVELAPDVVSPQVVMIYDRYEIQTPDKLTGSMAYVFGNQGLISFDVAFKNYGETTLTPSNDFRNLNTSISNTLTNTTEFRVGAEKKIKQLSLRAGYRFEESPYKDTKIMGDLNGYSGGLGYNFGTTKVDFSYSHSKRNYQQQFFSQGFTDSANIEAITNNFSLTFLFEL